VSVTKPDPEADEARDEHVREMLRGRRAVQRRKFPGLDVDVGVRPLAPAELADARHAARARVLANGADAIDLEPHALVVAFEQELVLRAVVDPTVDAGGEARPLFGSLEAVLELDEATRRALSLMALEAHFAVVPPDASPDEMQELVNRAVALTTWIDRDRARHASALCAFYGVRWQGELTDAQVAFFAQLTQPTTETQET